MKSKYVAFVSYMFIKSHAFRDAAISKVMKEIRREMNIASQQVLATKKELDAQTLEDLSV